MLLEELLTVALLTILDIGFFCPGIIYDMHLQFLKVIKFALQVFEFYGIFIKPVEGLDGMDPYTRISSMQSYYLINSDKAKKDKLNLLKQTIKHHTIPLDANSLIILCSLYKDEEFKAYSGEILLKNYFTIGDYYNAITISNELLKYLDKAKTISWINTFLQNSDYDIVKTELSLDKWISYDSLFTELEPELLPIVQKIKEKGLLSCIYNAISNHQISSLPQLYINCESIDSTETKERLYIEWWNSIKENNIHNFKSIENKAFKKSETSSNTSDCIGFSLIHYAILLNNRKTLDYVDMSSESIPVLAYNDPQLSILYNPLFIARYLNDNELFDILFTKTDEYKSLEKSKKIIDRKIAQTVIVINLAKQHRLSKIHDKEKQIANYKRYIKSLTTRSKNHYNPQNETQLREAKIRLQNMESELRHLKNSSNNIMTDSVIAASAVKLFENFKEEKKRTEEEIQELKQYFYKYYSEQVSILKEESNVFINYVLSIYSNPHEYINNLHFSDPIIIYYCEKPFIVSKKNYCSFESTFKSNYQKRRNTRTEHNKSCKSKPHLNEIVKPYGNSWFSPQAHKDIQILRKEYRKLALKYHPDSEMGSSEIFIDIQSERATILNGFE